MTDIIDFSMRKRLDAEQKAEEALAEIAAQQLEFQQHQEVVEAAILEDRKMMRELLEQAIALVDGGRLTGVLLIGIDPLTKLFFSEMRISQATVDRSALFGYIGVLESLKMEIVDLAMMAPMMQADGTVTDPFREETFDDEDDEEY